MRVNLSPLCFLVAFSVFCLAPAATLRAQRRAQPPAREGEQEAQAAPPRHELSAEATALYRTVQKVTFLAEGRELMGWVYKPEGDGPFPALVWNHGSEKNPVPHAGLALFYVRRGFVIFFPVRHGHGESPGEYIRDAVSEFRARERDPQKVREHSVELHELYNKDVVDAIAWLKQQPYVDASRLVVSGCSYGGIQTLLTAEKGLGVRAFIAFAPGAMSWANTALQKRELDAVKKAKAPLFLLQAENDYSLGPSEVLGPVIRSRGGANRAKVYPAFGTTHQQGHGAFATWEEGTAIWGPDVLDFLAAVGLTASPAARNR